MLNFKSSIAELETLIRQEATLITNQPSRKELKTVRRMQKYSLRRAVDSLLLELEEKNEKVDKAPKPVLPNSKTK